MSNRPQPVNLAMVGPHETTVPMAAAYLAGVDGGRGYLIDTTERAVEGDTGLVALTARMVGVSRGPDGEFTLRLVAADGDDVTVDCDVLLVDPGRTDTRFWEPALTALGLLTVSREAAELLDGRGCVAVGDTAFVVDLRGESSVDGVYLVRDDGPARLRPIGRSAGDQRRQHTRDRIIYDLIWSKERVRLPDPDVVRLLETAESEFGGMSRVRFLDLGCGRGRHALYAGERGARVIAVDHSARATKGVRAAAAAAGTNVDVCTDDLVTWVRDYRGKAEVIVCVCVIHHVSPDPDEVARTLRNMAELLVPGGYLQVALLTGIRYGDHPPPPGRLMLTPAEGHDLLTSALGHLELVDKACEFRRQEDVIHVDNDRQQLVVGAYESVRVTEIFRAPGMGRTQDVIG